MTSAFSTNDVECMSRETEHEVDVETIDEIWDEQILNKCVKWIKTHQFDKVSYSIEVNCILCKLIEFIRFFVLKNQRSVFNSQTT